MTTDQSMTVQASMGCTERATRVTWKILVLFGCRKFVIETSNFDCGVFFPGEPKYSGLMSNMIASRSMTPRRYGWMSKSAWWKCDSGGSFRDAITACTTDTTMTAPTNTTLTPPTDTTLTPPTDTTITSELRVFQNLIIGYSGNARICCHLKCGSTNVFTELCIPVIPLHTE